MGSNFLCEVIWRAKMFGSKFWEEISGEQILLNEKKNFFFGGGGGGGGDKMGISF